MRAGKLGVQEEAELRVVLALLVSNLYVPVWVSESSKIEVKIPMLPKQTPFTGMEHDQQLCHLTVMKSTRLIFTIFFFFLTNHIKSVLFPRKHINL